MTAHPESLIADQPMHWRQTLAVTLCIVLNGLDGFDVLAISFAAPGIADEWGITRAMLGVVLSVELVGMAIGSALLGALADRVGRRPTIIGCLILMACGMFAAALAQSIPVLATARLFTGLGIGGMIASTSAIVAEVSNARRRNLNLALNIAGYSAGAILGGSVAALLLAHDNDWRGVFRFGAIATLVALPAVALLLQESIGFLLARRPRGALEAINRILASYSRPSLNALPEAERQTTGGVPIKALFSRQFASITVLLTTAYFAQIMVFYFMQKWIPKIVVDMGYTAAEAATVLVSANIGCLLGALAIGLTAQFFKVVPVTIGAMIGAFLCVSALGVRSWDLHQLTLICPIAGLFVNAAVVGLYPVMARMFPAEVRASGIGFAIGVGRGGSALGPVAAGALFTWGYELNMVATVMASGALVAALALTLLTRLPVRRPIVPNPVID